MAIFNKLFTSRKTNSNNHENISDRHLLFTKEQVRVVLFRECDFRGRKLLFDSTAIKKVQLNVQENEGLKFTNNEKVETFAEISDGYGYMYIKPPTDSNHLAELIFGLVAMSYRGSYFKIHRLNAPTCLMFTQVFPSPKYHHGRKISSSSYGDGRASSQSLEHSIRLDDSGTSISDQLSVHSAASDTHLVYRFNMPSDGSHKLSESSSSIICDSGVYGERSFSSCDGNKNMNLWESMPVKGTAISFSNSTLYRRWLRSTSLDHSVTSSTSSLEETFSKPHQRTSKLGLAFVLQLTAEQEESQIQFLMEHIALLEAMLWRARQAAEIAYLRPTNFLSTLVKMVNLTSNWITNLILGPSLPLNLWTSLYRSDDNSTNKNSICDNNNSINECDVKCQKDTSEILRSILNTSSSGLFNSANSSEGTTKYFSSTSSGVFDSVNSNGETFKSNYLLSDNFGGKSEFSLSNITKLIKNEWDSLNSKMFGSCEMNSLEEKFVQEFCELLDTIDVKDTNFFVSTLLTAVLTHHLGWVATCLPPDDGSQILINIPFNPLWGQLSDLYGTIGHPSKMAQTIVMGMKRKDLVTKIINCLTYFIRCCDIQKSNFIRSDIDRDNKTADFICQKNSCIPKENFKKYEDHLRDMLETKEHSETTRLKTEFLRNTKGLYRTKKSIFNLKNLETAEDSLICNPVLSKANKFGHNLTNLKDLDSIDEKKEQFIYLENDSKIEIEGITSMSKDNVVFVLGDDEELVNIKKSEIVNRNEETDLDKRKKTQVQKSDLSIETEESNFLDLIFKKYETFEEEFSQSNFKDEDFVKFETDSCIKPSTSWASLQDAEDLYRELDSKLIIGSHASCSLDKPFVRSQSVPPEMKEKVVTEEVKAKYRYSGIKFSLHQYPQVVTNYMRSKNLEMANLSFSEITKKFDQISSENTEVNLDTTACDFNSDEMQALQTPSNASELEFTNDLDTEPTRHEHARESSEKSSTKPLIPECPKDNSGNPGFSSVQNDVSTDASKMKMIYFPMPKSKLVRIREDSIPYPMSVMRGLSDNYIPDLVLQGTSAPKKDWENALKNDLALTSQHCLLDQTLEEAIVIIGDTDNWEVQLMSSHTYVIDKTSSGVRVGMSPLVASMLDSLLKMWKLQVPAHFCLMHLEQRLQALCVMSKALARLLLDTELCSMEFLTSTLNLEVNDVPLLLAVASTYSPQVTQKYGISFQ